jgi:hypothetical protein
MTPSELVARAATAYSLSDSAETMAAAHLSAEGAAARAALLTARGKRLGTVFKGLTVLAVCGILALVSVFLFGEANSLTTTAQGTTLSFVDRCVLALALGSLLSIFAAGALYGLRTTLGSIWANRDDVLLLKPLDGLYQCEDALRHFREGGPLVAEWRDLALAERGQLHGFDVEMMAALHAVHNDEVERATYQARKEAACKEVHGITPSPAPALPPSEG